MKRTLIMRDAKIAHTMVQTTWMELKRWFSMGNGALVLSVKPLTRTEEASSRLHAMIDDIVAQGEYMGKKRSKRFWKGLFVSGWEIATGLEPEIAPGLEGEFVNIRRSTTELTQREASSVMEYVEAWGAMNGIKFRVPESLEVE